MECRPVAKVVNGVRERPDDWDKVVSKLVFRHDLVEGLEGLGRFRHIWVIFGFHRQKSTMLKVHPFHDPEMPLVGVFASRSPTRPNKIGLTLVRLVSVRGNVVTVKGLDALDGTPVLDVKPYEGEIDYQSRRPSRKSR